LLIILDSRLRGNDQYNLIHLFYTPK
jgi:hypothetical protein